MGRLERLLSNALNFTELGHYDNALKILDKANKLFPDDPEVFLSYALAYDAAENFSLSIIYYSKALALKPTDPHIYTQLGITFFKMNNPREAIIHFEKALDLDADYYLAKWHLALTYKTIGMYEDSLRVFKECYMIKSSDSHYFEQEINFQIGQCYYDMGWTHDALKYYRFQLEITPNDDWAMLSVGNCYLDFGWVEEAIKVFKVTITNSSSFIPAYSALALAYTENGWFDDAIDILRQAEKICPEDQSIKDNIDYIDSLKDDNGKNNLLFFSLLAELLENRKSKIPSKN